MSQPYAGPRDATYWKQRNTCQKILREGTGLAVERMTATALAKRMERHCDYLCAYLAAETITSAELARCAVEIREIAWEQQHRQIQLAFDFVQSEIAREIAA